MTDLTDAAREAVSVVRATSYLLRHTVIGDWLGCDESCTDPCEHCRPVCEMVSRIDASATRLERAIEKQPAPDAGLVEALGRIATEMGADECPPDGAHHDEPDCSTASCLSCWSGYATTVLAARRQQPEPGLVVRLTKRLGERWIHESDIADLAAEGRLESEVLAMVLEDLTELADGADWSVTWTPRAGEESE